jgi:hypothetical protein
MAALSKTRSLGNPQGRYPGACTISPVPLAISRQWWKRPSALTASAIALSVVALIGIGAATPTSSSQSPSTNQQNTGTKYDLQGTCLGEDSAGVISEVGCTTGSADWIVTNVFSTATFNESDCFTDAYVYAGQNDEYLLCIDEY